MNEINVSDADIINGRVCDAVHSRKSRGVLMLACRKLESVSALHEIKDRCEAQCRNLDAQELKVKSICSQLQSEASGLEKVGIWSRVGLVGLITGWLTNPFIGVVASAHYLIPDTWVIGCTVVDRNHRTCQSLCEELAAVGINRKVWLAETHNLIEASIAAQSRPAQEEITMWAYAKSIIWPSPPSQSSTSKNQNRAIEILREVDELICEEHAHYEKWVTKVTTTSQIWNVSSLKRQSTYNTAAKRLEFVRLDK